MIGTPPASRTSRTWRGSWSPSARDRGYRHQHDAHPWRRPLHGGAFRIGPDHIEVALVHRPRRRHGLGSGVVGARSRAPAHDPLTSSGWASSSRSTGPTVGCHRPGPARSMADLGRARPRSSTTIWPAFPADLMSSPSSRHAVPRHRDVFEKMFEIAPVLRRQARRRWARGSCCATRTARSWRALAAARRAGRDRRTSAPAWRC